MTWTLMGMLAAAAVVWGYAASAMLDRIVAPTRNGPLWTIFHGYVLALTTAIMLWLVIH